MSLLEQDTIRKSLVDKKIRQMEFDTGDNSGEYEIEVIWNNAVYTKKSKSGHLPGLYYLVSWKEYSEEENIWKPASTIQHFRKLISLFHKDYFDKPIAIFLVIDTALPMVRPIVKLTEPPK